MGAVDVTESWESFFVAEVGGSAALLGLLFVALSMNLAKILSFGGLADRALQALLLLLSILIVGSLMLMPAQPDVVIGLEELLVATVSAVTGILLGVRAYRQASAEYRRQFTWNLVEFVAVFVPCAVGGAIVTAGNISGVYWLAAGICLAFIKAINDAWVFLIEINR